jgi:general stress protein CsbA
MNPLWLILIVPVSMLAGGFCTALMAANKRK